MGKGSDIAKENLQTPFPTKGIIGNIDEFRENDKNEGGNNSLDNNEKKKIISEKEADVKTNEEQKNNSEREGGIILTELLLSTPTPEGTVVPTTAPEGTVVPTTAPEGTVAPTTAPEGTVAPTTAPEGTIVPTTAPEGTIVPTTAPEVTNVLTTAPEGTVAPTTAPEVTNVLTTAPEVTVVPTTAPEGTAVPTPSPEKKSGTIETVALFAIVLALGVCVGILLKMFLKQNKSKKQHMVNADDVRRKKAANKGNEHVQKSGGTEINNQRTGQVMCGIAQTIGAREQQQDSVYCSNWKDQDAVRARGILAAVSDGIGGLKDGNLASQGAMQAMRAAFLEDTGGFAAPDRLLNYAAAAQNKVLEINRTGNRCGATLVTVLITGREMNFLSIGDSRICLYRSGALLQLNREHVLGRQNAEKESLYNSGERLTAKRAGALTSYLGKEDLTLIDRSLQAMKLLSGDVILLMSDGVFNTLNDDELISLIRQEPQAAADAIIDAVEERANPRQDNATVLVIGIG